MVVSLALGIATMGAQPAPEATPEQVKQIATIMRSQRDALSQQLLDTQSQLQLVAAELDAAKKELATLKAKLADLEKPKTEHPSREAVFTPNATQAKDLIPLAAPKPQPPKS